MVVERCRTASSVSGYERGHDDFSGGLRGWDILDGAVPILAQQQEPNVLAGEYWYSFGTLT